MTEWWEQGSVGAGDAPRQNNRPSREAPWWEEGSIGPEHDIQEPGMTAGESLRSVGKTVDDAFRAVASGATFGYADEISAGARSFLGDGDYETLLADERARDEAVSPLVAVPGEIAGGVGTAALAAPGIAASGVTRMATNLPGWLKAAGLGGMFGGLYGSGTAEGDLGDRLEGGAIGAGAGAVTGGFLYPIVAGVQKGVGALKNAVARRTTPRLAAKNKLVEALARDEVTPGQVGTRLRALGPQATIADAGGRNVRGLARGVAGMPGAAGNRAEIILTQRAEGETSRITKAINKAGRGVDPTDYYAAEEGFLANLRERAAPLYQKAYQQYQALMTPHLNRMLNSKAGQRALREAAAITETERAAGAAKYLGAVDDELTSAMRDASKLGLMQNTGRPGVAKGFSLETWDQIKRGFDSLLDSASHRNELTGKLNKRGFAVDQMRRSLLKELDRATGGPKSAYAQARKIYSGDAETVAALRDGRKALRLDPEIIERNIRGLSESGQEAYRLGIARALKDIIDKTPDRGSAARRVFGNSAMRSKLRAAFGRDGFRTLTKTLVPEMRFAETKNFVLGGSPTAPRMAEQADVLQKAAGTVGVLAGSNLPGTHALLGAGIGRKVATGLFGPPPSAYNKELAQMLFNRNQPMNQHTLEVLARKGGFKSVDEMLNRTARDALLLGIAQQEGRMINASP